MADAAEAIATDADVSPTQTVPEAISLAHRHSICYHVRLHLKNCCLQILQVVDLLIAMANAAAHSCRANLIFDPYPSIVDPDNPNRLAIDPKVSRQPVGLVLNPVARSRPTDVPEVLW